MASDTEICGVVTQDYTAQYDNDISIRKGEVIRNLQQINEHWLAGTVPNGKRGFVPVGHIDFGKNAKVRGMVTKNLPKACKGSFC